VSDPIRYYLSVDGKRLGPYSAEQVRKRLNQGKSTETDYIWRDGFEEWKYIADVLSELPSEEPPPAPEAVIPTSVKINHPGFPGYSSDQGAPLCASTIYQPGRVTALQIAPLPALHGKLSAVSSPFSVRHDARVNYSRASRTRDRNTAHVAGSSTACTLRTDSGG